MRRVPVAAVAGFGLFAAFPPLGQAYLAVPAVAVLAWLLRTSRSSGAAALHGGVFGAVFFGFLFPWLIELGLIAFIPLWLVQSGYLAVYGAVVGRARHLDPLRWWVVAVGAWAAMEFARGRFPLGGFEWGFLGYPVGEYAATRDAAQFIGTTGWSVVVAALAAGLAVAVSDRRALPVLVSAGAVFVLVVGGLVAPPHADGEVVRVAAVQGSTPCPGTHCADERRRTWASHLALTNRLEPGSVDLVAWAEGSSGGLRADPVLVPEVGEAMSAAAERLGAALLAGGDRPVSDTEWINANVVFDADGELVGEYRKRHPVPFGEYVPARPWFRWIDALDAVPRDMVRGEGPVVFDLELGTLGSVISWEGSFARFARDEVRAGAEVLVVATNQGSYPFSYASDQLIGMTRMRSAELATDVVHVGVVGRSTIITDGGEVGAVTGLATREVLLGEVQLRDGELTWYARFGDWLPLAAMAAAAAVVAVRAVSSGWAGHRQPEDARS